MFVGQDASICAMEEHVQNLIKQEHNTEKGLTVVLEVCSGSLRAIADDRILAGMWQL